MTNAEMIVAIRVTAENVEETIESIKKSAEEMGATVEKVGRDAGNAFEPMKNSAAEAAAAQAALAAAAATAFKGVVSAVQSGTDAYNTYTSAIKGLDSIATGRGIGEDAMTRALESVTDEFMSAASAATAYKNLLSRGYSLDQATNTIKRLKDAATFGRQANLSLEEAVVNATEGIRNENSILVDNAGVTKNVAKMWEDYAKSRNLSVASLTQAQKVEAEYLGILEETKFQVGDLEKASNTLAGSQAEQAAQATKLATAFGDAMAPAVQAMTEAGTGFLQTATSLVQAFPALTSGATGAAAAFTGLVAALKGIDAIKGLLSAVSIGSATLGPLAAVAAAVGLVVTAYSKYADAKKKAAEADEREAKEINDAKQQELLTLRNVNTELQELYKQYGKGETSLSNLAEAYNSGNDAIVDRIRLLEQEQAALLAKQKTESEIALAEKQAELDRWQSAAEGIVGDISGERDIFKYTSAWTGEEGAAGDWASLWQQGLSDWMQTLETNVPEAVSLAEQLYGALYNAENLEEAQTIYHDFFAGLMEQIASTSDEATGLEEFIAEIGEALEDPEKFKFDETFKGVEESAKEGADGTDDLTDALKKNKKQADDLTASAGKLARSLLDRKTLRDQVSGYKDIAKETKKAGKGWDDLSDDVKKFAKQLGVADGDIDGTITALERFEGQLNSSIDSGVAELQNLRGQLAAISNAILSIPEAELTGDPAPILAAIAAAMAAIDELLEKMAEAGISAGGGGGGGGGGGRSSDDDSGGGGGYDPDEAAKDAYDEQIEALEHKRHLEKITAREEIEELERIKREYATTAELIMDIDERIYDARKELREEEAEKIDNYYDAILEALEERYEEQREAEQQRIEESIEAWERWSDETTAAIQAQIDALEEKEEAEERAEEEAEKLRRVQQLEASLPYERDEYNRQQILKQIEDAKADLQALYDEWAREDEKKALEDQMEAIRDQADAEIEKLEQESERIDSVYDKLTDGASLAAEAQKMLMDGNQKEILELISSYAPDYESTGRSLGEKLFDGFKAAFGDITDYFASVDAQFDAMVEKIQQSAFGNTQQIQQSGQSAANVSSPTINQTVNFNQPVESAVDVAERMQEVSEELAAMM